MKGLPSDLMIAAATMIALDAEGAPLTRVLLMPIGQIRLRDGRGPFEVKDRAAAEAVAAATRAYLGSTDFAFDYDHQTVFGAQPGIGGTAKAAGWVKASDIVADDEGVWAEHVDWTAAAEAALRAREYRYLSPLFLPGPGGQVMRLRNAALTISPSIDLPAIAASQTGEHMDLIAIAAALGLPQTASEADILAAIRKPSLASIAAAVGLSATASADEIAAAVSAIQKPDLSQYVPLSVVKPMQEQLAEIRTTRITGKVDDLVAAGVIPPTKRTGALDWFGKDEVAATAFYADMPAIVTPGAKPGGEHKPQTFTSLTADEVAACEMTGMSHADFLKAKNEDIA